MTKYVKIGLIVILGIIVPWFAISMSDSIHDRTHRVNACMVEVGPKLGAKDYCYARIYQERREE